jgi:glutathione S-transferase
MSEYTLYVNSMSPYSIKASALLGSVGFPCEPETQNIVTRYAVLKRLTGKTMVPVLRRGEWALNDSTRIARYAIDWGASSLIPDSPLMEALTWIVEEFADEWINRWFIYSRWHNERDFDELSVDVGREMLFGIPGLQTLVGRAAARMIRGQLERGGVSGENVDALEQSRDRTLQALEEALDGRNRPILGATPTVADFGLYGPLEQYRRDPTGGDRMERYPATRKWLERIRQLELPDPNTESPWLHPDDADAEPAWELLETIWSEFFGVYWRILLANLEAKTEGESSFEAELADGTTYRARAAGYTLGRLDHCLDLLDRVMAHRSELVERAGDEWVRAVDDATDRLAETPGGSARLEGYRHLRSPGQ